LTIHKALLLTFVFGGTLTVAVGFTPAKTPATPPTPRRRDQHTGKDWRLVSWQGKKKIRFCLVCVLLMMTRSLSFFLITGPGGGGETPFTYMKRRIQDDMIQAGKGKLLELKEEK
jgi:hypothetical protein